MFICLGWGSLVWNPGDLAIRGTWNSGGPKVKVEYARVSKDGRLTLVLDDSFSTSPTLWAEMRVDSVSDAIESLRKREGTATKFIGSWRLGDSSPPSISNLHEWAVAKRADCVVWTALPPKFNGTNGRIPSLEEELEHLRALNAPASGEAEEYVRKTPAQIRTPYGAAFEESLGWTQD